MARQQLRAVQRAREVSAGVLRAFMAPCTVEQAREVGAGLSSPAACDAQPAGCLPHLPACSKQNPLHSGQLFTRNPCTCQAQALRKAAKLARTGPTAVHAYRLLAQMAQVRAALLFTRVLQMCLLCKPQAATWVLHEAFAPNHWLA